MLLVLTVLCQSPRAASTNGALGFEGATRPSWGIVIFQRSRGILMTYVTYFVHGTSLNFILTYDRFVETRFKFQVCYQQTDEPRSCWLQTHVPLMHHDAELLSSVEHCSPFSAWPPWHHGVWTGNLQVAARFMFIGCL